MAVFVGRRHFTATLCGGAAWPLVVRGRDVPEAVARRSVRPGSHDSGRTCFASPGGLRRRLSDRRKMPNFAEFPHLLGVSIALSSCSSDRGEMPNARNPGTLSEAVVSICISST